MYEYFTGEDEAFVKKCVDYKDQCQKNQKYILTKFLNTRQQELLEQVIGKKAGIILSFYSPFQGANYKRAYITPEERDLLDYRITTFRIQYNSRYLQLNHKKILGNLMALQIKREVVGDIIITEDQRAYFCVLEELENFFIDNFRVIHQIPITLEKIDQFEDIVTKKEFQIKKIFVKSLRLDLILSHVFPLSREESKGIISQKYVQINYKIIENTSQNVNVCDIITTRTKGRFKIQSISGPNKSGNFVLEIQIYQ